MKIYSYKSPVGKFLIKDFDHMASLFIIMDVTNEERFLSSGKISDLLYLVYAHATIDCEEWMNLQHKVDNVPFHISQWTQEP